ncbi:MAG: rhomboid family intramembrane serine protease [Planctomycetes bacterium]|nr:rhomboid family intramembrane serine protease [Planctomycetota bacterium]
MPSPRWRSCPSCRALLDPQSASCVYCGAPLTGERRARSAEAPPDIDEARERFPVTRAITALLVAIYAAQLALQMLLYGEPPEIRGLFAFLAPSDRAQVLFCGLPPQASEPWYLGAWSYVLSSFSHAGLLHLGFNLSAFAVLGRRVESALGGGFALLLIGVGSLSLALAPLLQPGGHIGFSGVACAFLGAVLVHARLTRDEMVVQIAKHWTISMAIWSLMPGVSWAGHLAGFALGALLTALWLAPMARALRSRRARRAAGALSAVALLACVALHLREALPALRYRKFNLVDELAVRLYNDLSEGRSDRSWAEAALRDLDQIGPLPGPWQELGGALATNLDALDATERSPEERRRATQGLVRSIDTWIEERKRYLTRLSSVLCVEPLRHVRERA